MLLSLSVDFAIKYRLSSLGLILYFCLITLILPSFFSRLNSDFPIQSCFCFVQNLPISFSFSLVIIRNDVFEWFLLGKMSKLSSLFIVESNCTVTGRDFNFGSRWYVSASYCKRVVPRLSTR